MSRLTGYLSKAKSIAKQIWLEAKAGRQRVALSFFSVVFAVCLVISFVFSGARVVYRVKYSGKNIAIVQNKESFDNAKRAVVNLVQGKNVEKAFAETEYTATLAPTFAVSNQSEIVDAIIDNTDDIIVGSVLNVNGERRLCAESTQLSECMESYLKNFEIPEEECSTFFMENIKIDNGYFLKDGVCDEEEIYEVLSSLNVMTEVTFVTDITIPYSSYEVRDGSSLIGMRKVVTAGRNGINRVVKQNIYINGVLTSEVMSDEEVVSEPVDEVVSVGTVMPDLSKIAIEFTGSGLVFPLSAGRWSVGAYFGDDRNHKGVDLSTDYGVPILAAQSGTVTLSQWYYGYGNCVIIDHGNGFTTLYGHASQLLVTPGQHVNAGDVIALVGSTGDSTGNHLHFEISVNGSRIDPGPYIGLY